MPAHEIGLRRRTGWTLAVVLCALPCSPLRSAALDEPARTTPAPDRAGPQAPMQSQMQAQTKAQMQSQAKAQTQVVMLGTGTPNADPDRSGPSVAIVTGGRAYLVDCGPGVVRRAAAAQRNGIDALAPEKLGIVFITHLHSDHTLGLPDLMLTPWVLERREPLEVYGPKGVRSMTDHLLAAYAEDIRVRLDGLEPDKTEGWQVHAHELAPGLVYQDSNVRVTAFAVPHANWRHAYGYRFETADRVIVISGDTRPSDAVVEACNGCDILIHEVYSADRLATRPPEWQRYHTDAHTSSTELAALATRAKPRLLVLYHQLLWGTDDDGLVREVRRGYDGAVVAGKDLEVYR